jgi:hypothetical protein
LRRERFSLISIWDSNSQSGNSVVDADDLRARAKILEDLVVMISDPIAAERTRRTAARYRQEADNLEKTRPPDPENTS